MLFSVAASVLSMAGEDCIVLCLGKVQSTRREDLLHCAFRSLGRQVMDSFEDTLHGSYVLSKLGHQLGRLVFQLRKLVLQIY
jgi:hypothetical protein